LIVQRPFQSVDGVCFCIDRKELTPELLFEVDPGLNWKNASVHLLAKEVLEPLRSMSILEEGKGPKDFFLAAGELLWGQTQIQSAGVEESSSGAPFAGEVGGRGKFRPCSLFRRSGRSRGGGDTGIGSGAGHKLGDLLQLSGQGRKSGVDSMFRSVLSFSQLLEMVL